MSDPQNIDTGIPGPHGLPRVGMPPLHELPPITPAPGVPTGRPA